MATAYKKGNGDWSVWTVAKIKGEKGDTGDRGLPGTPGADGANIEYVFYRTNGPRPGVDVTRGTYTRDVFDQNGERDDTVAKTPITEGQIDLMRADFFPAATGLTVYSDGAYWHDNPAGVNEQLTHEWIAMRFLPAGAVMWSDFNVALWSKFGEAGRDGDGIEYVFWPLSEEDAATITGEVLPTRKSNTSYRDTNNRAIGDRECLPSITVNGKTMQAVDNNPGISPEYPSVYASMRKYNGLTKT